MKRERKMVIRAILAELKMQVVNKSQQVVTAGLKPDPAYSRQIALELHVPGAIGGEDYCFTPTLGNSLVLYGIDLWFRCGTRPGEFGGYIYLMFGSGEPQTAGEIATRWTSIIPLHCGIKPGFRILLCEQDAFHISMKKKFVADELRFGVTMENLTLLAWEATVLFEISEG